MRYYDYEELYSNVIEKYIDEILEYDRTSGYHCVSVRKSGKQAIYKNYERKRLDIRNGYMKTPDNPLDRHKIGAVFMYAILKSRILRVDRMIPNLPDKLLMANEYLAVYVAINIVEMYKRDLLSSEGSEESDFSIIFPKTYIQRRNIEHGEFVNDLCKSMYYIPSKNSFDVFAYAIVLFMLEKDTDRILEMESHVKEE